jgi:peptidoglycan hydrolase-like protein with peptidoglycan-binding domain
VERWFQNTRGLVIVVLAIATCVLLLATEPGDGFPTGISTSSGGDSSTITLPVTTAPSVTTTTFARPTLQEGTADTANTTVLQQRLNALGYDVGTPDGSFGPGTKAQVVKFQTDKGITPADGVVNQATWNALLANPTTTTAPATTTKG